MTIWIDAQLSPAIAIWIEKDFNIKSVALRDLNLRDAEDEEIFDAAKKANAVVITKDSDFLSLLDRYGAPPKIICKRHFYYNFNRMKKIIFLFLGLFLLGTASENLFAQNKKLTIILLRHAEKDLTDRNKTNPEL